MSFIKTVFNHLNRQEPIDAEKVRKQAWIFLFVGIFFFVLFLGEMVEVAWDSITFYNVIPNKLENLPGGEVKLPFGVYSTIEAGILHYNTPSVIDRFLFHTMGSLNLLDFLFFLFVGIVLYRALKNVNEQSSFHLKISKAYRTVGLGCFWMFVLKMLYSIFIMRKYFRHITGNQFSFAEHTYDIGNYLYAIIGGLIISFVYFMNKGEALQKANDLTI